MKKRKAVHLLLCMFLVAGMLSLCAVPASAERVSGSCGETLTWTLNTETWELTISGTGAMTSYTSSDYVPWKDYREQIRTITLKEGMTECTGISFFSCSAVREVTLPRSLEILNRSAFQWCDSLRKVTVLNPECQLFWKPEDVGRGSVILCGYRNSTAYDCALENHFCFQDVETGELLLTWTENEGAHTYEKWSSTVKSYLYDDGGIITRVEQTGDRVLIEQYDGDYRKLSTRTLDMELPVFGGFYAGTKYNYLVFGQANPEEDDSTEVFRTVKYSRDWKRLGAASIFGADTYMPFEAGSLRMTEYEGMLYVHTCHKLYKSGDGLRHQASVTYAVRTSDMAVTDQLSGVSNSMYGYSSHSFNQFILTDGNRLVTAVHADAHPRAAGLYLYGKPAGQETYVDNTCRLVSALPITGGNGNNYTGVNIGGFEVSSSAYLLAGSSILQDGSADLRKGQKNIFLTVTDKENFSSGGTTLRWFSSYEEGSKTDVSNPFLEKVGEDRFLLMWTAEKSLHYIFVNGRGESAGKEYTSSIPCLSDCQPLVSGGKIIWYAVKAGQDACFYEIDTAAPETVRAVPQHTCKTEWMEPTCTKEGGLIETCVFCGERTVTNPVSALGHSWDKGTVTKRASYLEKGVRTYVCTRCGTEKTEDIPVRDLSEPCDGSEICPGSAFFDMPAASHWAHAGIDWAIVKKITNGTSTAMFSPEQGCTRAQVVTFLWRTLGSPEPSAAENPFSDVQEKEYYYKAVLWAVEKNITKGTGEDRFSPDSTCTRGQIVTFLWRFRNSPAPAISDGNPFLDVNAGDYYYTAVLWAAGKGVTTGTSAQTFSPSDTCTRAQVVTFLHRAAG